MTETGSSKGWASGTKGYLTRALALYAGGSFAVLQLVDIFVDQLGLPDWFFPGTVVLLLLGLPIVVATGLVHSRASGRPASSAGELAPGSPARAQPGGDEQRPEPKPSPAQKPWLSWRKAVVGGALVLAVWGLVVAAYMVTRALGIGPVGSLVAAGVIDERERVIIAEFENHTGDPLLGQAATEAFRVDFSQSPILTVMDRAYVGQVLTRMQREPDQTLDLSLAREVAIREGIKAVVAGEITPVGTKFQLTAELISAEDGRVLAARRETAADSTAIIDAIDKLSNGLRARIGESLRTIRANEPLDRVTTGSLEALRRYSQAIRVIEQGDSERAIALLREAVALDTAFAMAWRKLGVTLGNIGRDRVGQIEALERAYAYRESRLTERERYLTQGSYYAHVTGETDKAIAAYRSLLDMYPHDTWALNNLAILYLDARDFQRAERLLRRAIELDSASALQYGNVITTQVSQGKISEAEETLRRLAEKAPGHPNIPFTAAALASSRFDYDTAETIIRAFREAHRASELWQTATSFQLAQLAEVRGRLSEAESYIREAMARAERQGELGLYLLSAVRVGFYNALLRGQRGRAIEVVDAALNRHPLATVQRLDRPYELLALFYAVVERPQRARALLAASDTAGDRVHRPKELGEDRVTRGVLALAEERVPEAIEYFRRADEGACTICALPFLGQAYDAAGQPDSVIAIYERYLSTPSLERLGSSDWYALAGIYERLAGLYALRGDTQQAIRYYERFVELWKDADPELRPRVEAARRAIEKLAAET